MTANHQHVGPSGTVTCDLIHPETPHDLVRPAAPRENGCEELRREIEALPGFLGPRPVNAHEYLNLVDRAAVLAIVDRLTAARGEPLEDAERLRRIEKAAQDVVADWPPGNLSGPANELRAAVRWPQPDAVKEAYDAAIEDAREGRGLWAARGEPQENGWLDALSEASEGRGDWLLGWQAAIEAVRDRLAAARGEPPEPGPAPLPQGHPDTWSGGTMHMAKPEPGPAIDVELLATAMTTVYEEDLFPIKSGDWRYDASLIAAEYERLSGE